MKARVATKARDTAGEGCLLHGEGLLDGEGLLVLRGEVLLLLRGEGLLLLRGEGLRLLRGEGLLLLMGGKGLLLLRGEGMLLLRGEGMLLLGVKGRPPPKPVCGGGRQTLKPMGIGWRTGWRPERCATGSRWCLGADPLR